jgi:DNA segregation ATPase FtsK/SpoIIIE, S-DNA-T family
MTDAVGPPTRWRLDGVALTLIGLAGVVGWVLLASPPFANTPNPAGPAADVLARWLTDSLGLGLVTFLAGWLVWIGLYIAKRSALRLTVRGLGWLWLSVATAWLADGWMVPGVSRFGSGGSIGAWLHFNSTDQLLRPLPVLALSAALVIGLLLTIDNLLRGVGKFTSNILKKIGRGLKRGNDAVGKVTVSPHPVALQPPSPAKPGEGLVPAPLSQLGGRGAGGEGVEHTPLASEEPIPIIRHTQLQQTEPTEHTPPPLRLIPRDAVIDVEPAPRRSDLPDGYKIPSLNLLAEADHFPVQDHEQKLRERAAQLEKTFTDFGLNVKVVGIHTGPVITQYEVALETGLRLNKVTVLSDDIALNLGVASVRIVAPLPNRTTVGLEVPNDHRQTVRLKELIQSTTAKTAKFKLPVFLGKDVEGRPLVYDMATMPHLLIAGRTGTGKSVCLNAIIQSFLLTRQPDECRLILIDPKKVEFSDYARIPHLMHPVVTDDKKAEAILSWAILKMDERYELLRKARVRNISSYNELSWEEIERRVSPQTEEERRGTPKKLPYIVLVIDEVGDLLMTMKKEVENHIIRLAQKSRAAGIHLILATQKPTVDVITGLIKSNLPARICFQVASRADSAVVLDEKGAEKLLGLGDMLFLQPGTSTIIRGQGAFVDDGEIQRITEELAQYEPNFEHELLNLETRDTSDSDEGDFFEKLRERDGLYEQAVEVVIREQRGSTSLLQRALGIGYGRASRLIDFMAEDGIVGSFNGSNARDVLVSSDEWELRKKGA